MTTRNALFTGLFLSTVFAAPGCGNSSSGPQALESEVTEAECVGSYRSADEPAADTADTGYESSIEASASGSTVTVLMHEFYANCCPTPGSEVTLDGSEISVAFTDVTNEMEVCDCMCVTEFALESADVASGTYQVTVTYNEDETYGPAEVVVP